MKRSRQGLIFSFRKSLPKSSLNLLLRRLFGGKRERERERASSEGISFSLPALDKCTCLPPIPFLPFGVSLYPSCYFQPSHMARTQRGLTKDTTEYESNPPVIAFSRGRGMSDALLWQTDYPNIRNRLRHTLASVRVMRLCLITKHNRPHQWLSASLLLSSVSTQLLLSCKFRAEQNTSSSLHPFDDELFLYYFTFSSSSSSFPLPLLLAVL